MNAPAIAERKSDILLPGFGSAYSFELLQRESKVFAASSMVPPAFRQWNLDRETGQLVENPEAVANSMIALNMAIRMGADPLMVMQNLYIVHGQPSWSTKFLIALFNACGRFTALRYALPEKKDACHCYCVEIATQEKLKGPTWTLDMARKEGLTQRKGNKWLTIPEIMLMNRAASSFIRLTAPELSMGLPTREEAEDYGVIDMGDIEPAPSALQTVRDILAKAPSGQSVTDASTSAPVPSVPMPPLPDEAEADPPPMHDPESAPPVSAPSSEGADMIEPKDLPLKDGELTPQDAQRKAKPARAKAETPRAAFNVDAFASRIAAISDVDMLTLIRDEIGAMPPSNDREDCFSLLDARTRELLSTDEGET
jgi:hypothetical protein